MSQILILDSLTSKYIKLIPVDKRIHAFIIHDQTYFCVVSIEDPIL